MKISILILTAFLGLVSNAPLYGSPNKSCLSVGGYDNTSPLYLHPKEMSDTENKITDDHKYYVSVSNVKYNTEAQSLQMVTRFFIDDLQEVLNTRNPIPVELGVVKDIENQYTAIERYLDAKLSIEVNGKTIQPDFIGAEYQSDQIILYIEFKTGVLPTSLEMSFNAFFELFEEQKNLVHFNINDQRKTLILERSKSSDTVSFN